MTSYRQPDDLLAELGIETPDEIDIEAIAYHCGAIVRYRRLDGCAARIIGRENKAVISVDRNSGHGRQRFSVGHELGHWMRDRGKAAYLCQKKDLRTPWAYRADPESQANAYSANLLMPRSMFEPGARMREMTFKTVAELKTTFKTSLTATAIRLVELGSFPAMLVCHGMEGRRWFSSGSSVPRALWPHRELSHNTQAFELLFSGSSSDQPVLVDADEWISHRDSERYCIYEHSVKIAGDAILSMLWWKDESQILDLSD